MFFALQSIVEVHRDKAHSHSARPEIHLFSEIYKRSESRTPGFLATSLALATPPSGVNVNLA